VDLCWNSANERKDPAALLLPTDYSGQYVRMCAAFAEVPVYWIARSNIGTLSSACNSRCWPGRLSSRRVTAPKADSREKISLIGALNLGCRPGRPPLSKSLSDWGKNQRREPPPIVFSPCRFFWMNAKIDLIHR